MTCEIGFPSQIDFICYYLRLTEEEGGQKRKGQDKDIGFFVTRRECDLTFMERKDQAFVTLFIDKFIKIEEK